jgi:hypothetical protein
VPRALKDKRIGKGNQKKEREEKQKGKAKRRRWSSFRRVLGVVGMAI